MKAGYPPIDIKFADWISYYNAFDEYHVKHNLGAMEKLFAGYVNARMDKLLVDAGKITIWGRNLHMYGEKSKLLHFGI